MIKENEVLHLIIDSYPRARSELVLSADDWISHNGNINAHALLRCVVRVVVSSFVLGDYENSEKLFELIERFIIEGEVCVANAACTCFVESLQNIASHGGEFENAHFLSLLGEKSKEHATAWNAFNGVKFSEF